MQYRYSTDSAICTQGMLKHIHIFGWWNIWPKSLSVCR